ncbi:MAG: hypothetical protein DME30_05750 [Verrucomicrobia bacterium]|nr:MAG: hypothetical protein DME30_05750 [Verrucomicrobiota bacterium]
MGAGAAPAIAPGDENALWRRRGNVRRDSQIEARLRNYAGRRNRDRYQLGRSGSVGGEIREPDYSRSDRGARDRYSRRASRERHSHSLPNRWNSARSRGAAAVAVAPLGDHFPTQGDVAHGHRRLLSRGGQQFGFQRLDMSKKQEKTIRHLLAQPNGIILLTGPTGCGKSTSLYCFLSTINSVSRRIITIEEPVEYKLPGVLQMDVKPEIDFTFARGLRHILRQDPNVVMVGEIRDIETADIAIRAAMTGHLVFSTLHTNDAVGGITRLLDMDVEPFLLASVVKSFIAQRLVRTVCPECAEKVEYPSEYLAEIGFPLKELGARFTRGKGCEQCRHTGYQGRAAIYEICVVTEPLRKLIMQKKDGGELKQCAIAEGMETLRQDGWRRVAKGNTTIEEVVRVTQTDEVMAETTEDAEPVMKR